MSTDDLDVTPTTPANVGGLDPLFNQMYGGGTGTETTERRVGFPVIDAFTHYVLKPSGARRHRTTTNVGAKVSVEVLEGPGETVGFKFTDSGDAGYGFIVSRESGPQGKRVTLNDEEWNKKVENRRRLFNRIRQVLGLGMAVPPGSFNDAAVDAYCAQFANARPFVAEVRVEVGLDGVQRNKIVWESIAALDEQELDRNKKPLGKTAHQFAKEKIAAYKPKGGAAAAPTSASSLSSGDIT